MRDGYDYLVQVDGDGQHDPAEIRRLEHAMAGERGRHGLRLALSQRRPQVPGAGQPPNRHPPVRLSALAHRAPARERPDLGLSALQPPRDRRVCARLSARLPGGRGGADGPRPPAAHVRGAGAHVSPRRRRVLDHRHRASPPTTWSRSCWRSSSGSRAGVPPSSRATRRRWPPTASDGRSHPGRRDHGRRGPARACCSSSCGAAACSSATPCCGCSARSSCSPWRSGAACSRTSPSGRASPIRRTRSS